MNCGSLFVVRHSGTMKRRILNYQLRFIDCAIETAATDIAALRKITVGETGKGNRPPDKPFGVFAPSDRGWFVRRIIEYRRGD